MAASNKHYETGSNPYYLNLNNTAKDFSNIEATNPQFGLLDFFSKHILIKNDSVSVPLQLTEDLIIVEEKKD